MPDQLMDQIAQRKLSVGNKIQPWKAAGFVGRNSDKPTSKSPHDKPWLVDDEFGFGGRT
jgi:hypothetical protein